MVNGENDVYAEAGMIIRDMRLAPDADNELLFFPF